MDWVFLGCSVVLVGGRGKFPEYSFVVYWMGYTVVFFHNNNKKKKTDFLDNGCQICDSGRSLMI